MFIAQVGGAVDRDVVLTGALCHDVGKPYAFDPVNQARWAARLPWQAGSATLGSACRELASRGLASRSREDADADRALHLEHAERPQDQRRAGGDGPALQRPSGEHRQGRAVRPGLPEDQPEQPHPGDRRSGRAGGGRPISVFESGAILLYLGEKTGQFWPHDLREQVPVLEWLMWQMGGFGPMPGQVHHFLQVENEDDRRYGLERYSKETRRLYGVLDRRLARRGVLRRRGSRSPTSPSSAGPGGTSGTRSISPTSRM